MAYLFPRDSKTSLHDITASPIKSIKNKNNSRISNKNIINSSHNNNKNNNNNNNEPFVSSSQESLHEIPAVEKNSPKKPKIRLENRNAYYKHYLHMLLLKERIFYILIAAILSFSLYYILYAHTTTQSNSTLYFCAKSPKCMAVIGFLLTAVFCGAYMHDRIAFRSMNSNQEKSILMGFTNPFVRNMDAETSDSEESCNTQLVNCLCETCQHLQQINPKNKYRVISHQRTRKTSAPTTPTGATSMKEVAKSPIHLGGSPMANTSNNSSLMWQQCSPNTSGCNTSMSVIYNTSAKENFINDKENLRDFLRSVRHNDNDFELKPDDPRNKVIFETPVYQFAPLPEIQPTLPEHDSNSITKVERKSHLLKDIKQEQLVQYLANLRRWLSKTIIERLCQEIDKTNEIFKNTLNSEERIGVTSIERLRKMSLDKEFVNRVLPHLPLLYRFLNLCPNQAYLVQRIKELATGTCLAEYSWKNLNMRLPSDAAILFHLFCVYMDSQLNPMPQGCSERPFHSQYVIMDDGKRSPKELIQSLKNRAQCAIVCSGLYTPKFRFICNGEIQSSASGANNLFHVILYFLLYLHANNISSLEGVSLGKQGINIACIIEE